MLTGPARRGRPLLEMNGNSLKRHAFGFVLAFSTLAAAPAWAVDVDDLLSEGNKEAKKPKVPVFVIPFQPVWKMAKAELVAETYKNVASEFRQAGFDLQSYDLRVDAKPFQDPSARLAKVWARDLRRAEQYTQKLRFRMAKKHASKVIRQILQNGEHLREPKLLCRSLALVAEADLRRGNAGRAEKILDKLSAQCDGAAASQGDAQLSTAFEEAMADADGRRRRRVAGELIIRADEPHAQVYVNGRALGEAPVRIKEMPPGDHVVGVTKAGLKSWGKVVKVGSEAAEVRASLSAKLGGARKGEMVQALRDNQLTTGGVGSAAKLLSAMGKGAKVGIFGVVAKEGAAIRVRLIAFDNRGRVHQFKPMNFDTDFLTTGTEMFGFADTLKALNERFDGKSLKADLTMIPDLKRANLPLRDLAWAAGSGRAGPSRRASRDRGPLQRRTAEDRKREAEERARKRDQERKRMFEDRKKRDREARDRRSARRDVQDEDRRSGPIRRDDRRSRRDRDDRRGRSDRDRGDDWDRADNDDRRRRGDRDRDRDWDDDPDRDDRRGSARRSDDRDDDRAAGGDRGDDRRSKRDRDRPREAARTWSGDDGPRRRLRRRRGRVNWGMVGGIGAASVLAIGGGYFAYQQLTGAPAEVNVGVTWNTQ